MAEGKKSKVHSAGLKAKMALKTLRGRPRKIHFTLLSAADAC
jgi:hypothetical protein